MDLINNFGIACVKIVEMKRLYTQNYYNIDTWAFQQYTCGNEAIIHTELVCYRSHSLYSKVTAKIRNITMNMQLTHEIQLSLMRNNYPFVGIQKNILSKQLLMLLQLK